MLHWTFQEPPPGADEGELIRGDVRLPEGAPPRTAIVLVHGFKGFKDWGFFPWVAEELAAAGHAVVSFNFSRNGIGADPETFSELERFGRNTLTRELDELLWVLGRVAEGEWIRRRPRRIGLLGHSRGGGDAVLAAREHEGVDALVTWSAVATFDRWSDETKEEWREDGVVYVLNTRTGQQMPLEVSLLEDYEAHRDRLDIEAAAAEVAVPWLIVHGRTDLSVDEEDARRLARASADARLLLVEDAGHTYEAGHPFEGPSPELIQVLEATRRHFHTHLEPE